MKRKLTKFTKPLATPNARRVLAVLMAALIAGWYIQYFTGEVLCEINRDLGQTTISAKGRNVTAEVVRDEAEKAKGLSDRKCLGEGKGMLFAYDTTGDFCFWMKDMNFPIDMLWINDDKTIVTVEPRVSPDTYPAKTFCPDRPAQYVLELNAGVAEDSGWGVGTKLKFDL